MSKVIMFSRVFPKSHPRAGQETNFMQKIWKAINVPIPVSVHADKLNGEVHKLMSLTWRPKYHTIRKGSRFKPGDKFSPRVWEGKPYGSKQIIIADDIEVKKIFDFEMDENGVYSINGKYLLTEEDDKKEMLLARNDGFNDPADFFSWFMPDYSNPKPFKGQIICWNENIEY